MGNGASFRRNRRNQQINGTQDAHDASPAGYLPYYYPAQHNGNYPQGLVQSNAQLVINIQSNAFTHMMSPHATAALPLPDYVAEHQKANTIKNDVNLQKATLSLEKDEENPGFHLVSFSFDATVGGWICIFFHAKEGQECSLTPAKPQLYAPVRIRFEKGLGQKFRQASGTGVNLALFEVSDLLDEGAREVFPLVVRTETIPKDPPPGAQARDEAPIDAPLPKWVHAQTTHAVLEKKEDTYSVKVVKQTIYVEGVRYELQEIYGIENTDGSGGIDGNDSGKECVICMSEQRDTTVLPCRHMCMCSKCAKVLRFQSNRCPICRTSVERLLEIKVSKKEGEQGGEKAKSES